MHSFLFNNFINKKNDLTMHSTCALNMFSPQRLFIPKNKFTIDQKENFPFTIMKG